MSKFSVTLNGDSMEEIKAAAAEFASDTTQKSTNQVSKTDLNLKKSRQPKKLMLRKLQ